MQAIPPAIEIVILAEAEKNRVPAWLAIGLAFTESRFNPVAISPRGAKGLFQLMPTTGRALGLLSDSDFFDPAKNTRAALAHLGALGRRYGAWYLALAAYNRGQGWLQKNADHNQWPAELTQYINQVYAAGGKTDGPKRGAVEIRNRDISTGRIRSVQSF